MLSLTCISKGGKPAASVNWKLSGTDITDDSVARTELETNGFRYTVISTLEIKVLSTQPDILLPCIISIIFEFQIDKSSQGKMLSCEAQNGAAEPSMQVNKV